ncbi:MAG: hypothetical protein ACK4Q5_12150 [Saprospiraceae bacterium]
MKLWALLSIGLALILMGNDMSQGYKLDSENPDSHPVCGTNSATGMIFIGIGAIICVSILISKIVKWQERMFQRNTPSK